MGPISTKQLSPESAVGASVQNQFIHERLFQAAGTIAAGDIVYVSGCVSATNPTQTVVAASAAAYGTSTGDLWVAQHAATSGSMVRCSKYWVLASQNTSAASNVNDPWFLTTAGAGAASPTAGHTAVPIGIVRRVNASTGIVELCPDVARQLSPMMPVTADPGNAGAINVRVSSFVPIVTAGAETRTLAVPKFIGQRLSLFMDTDGGDCVITVTQAINATGNNTITMNDARDAIHLVGITVGGALRWEVQTNSGCTLSTV